MKKQTPSSKAIVNGNFGASKECANPLGAKGKIGDKVKVTKTYPNYKF